MICGKMWGKSVLKRKKRKWSEYEGELWEISVERRKEARSG